MFQPAIRGAVRSALRPALRGQVVEAAEEEPPPPPPPFSPSDLGTDLILWLDAQDSATLLDSEGGSEVGPGDTIGWWVDRSIASRDSTAPGGASGPTLGGTAINGHAAGSFDSSTGLLVPTLGTLGAFELWLVCQVDNASTTRILAENFDGGGGYITLYYDAGSVFVSVDGVASMLSRPASTATPLLIRVTVDTSLSTEAVTLEVNGSTAASGANGAIGSTLAGTDLRLGRRYDNSLWLVGALGEVIAVNRTLTGDEATNLRTYLETRWGL